MEPRGAVSQSILHPHLSSSSCSSSTSSPLPLVIQEENRRKILWCLWAGKFGFSTSVFLLCWHQQEVVKRLQQALLSEQALPSLLGLWTCSALQTTDSNGILILHFSCSNFFEQCTNTRRNFFSFLPATVNVWGRSMATCSTWVTTPGDVNHKVPFHGRVYMTLIWCVKRRRGLDIKLSVTCHHDTNQRAGDSERKRLPATNLKIWDGSLNKSLCWIIQLKHKGSLLWNFPWKNGVSFLIPFGILF